MESLTSALTKSLETLRTCRQAMEEILECQDEKMKVLRQELEKFDKVIISSCEQLVLECAKMQQNEDKENQ